MLSRGSARPIAEVQAVFDAAGIRSVLNNSTDPTVPTTLDGYYSCDSPPQVGFGFPSITDATAARSNSSSPVSHQSTIFNVLPAALALPGQSHGEECISSIRGTDEFSIWILGQRESTLKCPRHPSDKT
jgi:hypothetical protein